jgi:hypothetical protein
MQFPEIDHKGKTLPAKTVFFKEPGNIGLLITGESSLKEGDQPRSGRTLYLSYIKTIIFFLFLSIVIILIGRVNDRDWMLFWIITCIIIAVLNAFSSSLFRGESSYVGTKGFAKFTFINSPNNITSSTEISFDYVSDLIKETTMKYKNFSYVGTHYSYSWIYHGEVVFKMTGRHDNKHDEVGKYPAEYNFMASAEVQWTNRLIERMDEQLREFGFIQFNCMIKEFSKWKVFKHIRLGMGYIEIVNYKAIVKYDIEEINRVYVKNGTIIIEHSNYQKKLLGLIQSGDKAEIVIDYLSNQAFFFFVYDRLVGVPNKIH